MSEITQAAGGVVWRKNTADEVEIAIIHHPRYDDWSLPKGKLDSGETLIACAYREIMKQTEVFNFINCFCCLVFFGLPGIFCI